KPPPPVLPLAGTGEAFTTSHVGKARTITITPPGAPAETWTYSAAGHSWLRSGTPGVAVANLILQNVDYKQVLLRDPDRFAQSARVLGRGICTAVSGGTVTPCSWYKRSATSVTGYVDAAGVPLRFGPGHTSARTVHRSGPWLSRALRSRGIRLPTHWPFTALVAFFPIWWALGLGSFAIIGFSLPMLLQLRRARPLRVPRGFAFWLCFLAAVLVSG